MTLLYYDPIFLAHETGPHPERAERLRRIVGTLQERKLWERCRLQTCEPASPEQVERVHDADYLEALARYAERGGGRIEVDTIVSPRSYEAARRAAGAACDAVRRVIGGEADNALCLVRPPGHHALRQAPMGFCLINSVAVAARAAVEEHGLERVLIVDWDVHHGNGTQSAFWEDPRVSFFSIHRAPFYPYTGDSGETGSGPGLGTTLNLPVEFGTARREYLAAFSAVLARFAAKTRPQLVLVSAGFDTHRLDPIGSLGLETEDFIPLTQTVLGIAGEYAQGRLVSLLEGGYNVDVVGDCAAVHLEELLKASPARPATQ
jgi:acetoin utilization deacetylase AcuC-like enzyme